MPSSGAGQNRWMNLLEAMRYLAALERHRHFGRAAEACHITQPALSNAIRALEAEFGVSIVRRSRQYEGLTPEGEQVLAAAHRMLHEREALRQDLHARADAPGGALELGAVPTAMPVAARFAALLRERHPGIVTRLRSMSSPEIESGIEQLALDLAFGYSERAAERGARIAVTAQYEEHYFLLRRAELPSGGMPAPRRIGSATTWSAAATLPLCMLTPEMHNRVIVDGAFAAAGARVEPVLETNSVLALVLAVAAGDGVCAVLPGALVAFALQMPGTVAQPLVEPTVRTPIGVLTAPGERRSLVLRAALACATSAPWQAVLARETGPLHR